MNNERRYDFSRVDDGDTTLMAERLGVARAQVIRWRTRGLTEQAAGRVAQALGLVDFEVWPELLPDPTKTCAAEGCEATFVPPLRHPYKKFCSMPCKNRQQRRNQYRNDPAFRELVKKRARRYYSETREWQVKRSRWYREQAKRRAA